MNSAVRLPARIGPRTLLITAAVPLTGWAVHAAALHKRLAATRRDPLTGLLRRDAYTASARRLLARHSDNTAVIMIDADRFKAINDGLGHAAGDTVLASIAFPVKLMCSDSESAVAVRAPAVGSVAGVLVSVPACVPLDAAGIDL
ncbi:diguanylate cyclase [Streptomyces anulatus]|uniref:diguanylate cyclase n=1 Tax=Streptomyces anulatus TaxID=1892 RepID=UPI002B1CBD48|nr:diguanylate cyclase [Streptomyces anulatus]